MADWLTPSLFAQGGAVAGAVWGLITGRLVPRQVVEDVRADRDARVAEANARTTSAEDRAQQWQQAWLTTSAAAHVSAGQVGELLELARLAPPVARAITVHPDGATTRPAGGTS